MTCFLLCMVLNKKIIYSHCFFNFAFEYVIRKIEVNQEDLKLNGTNEIPVNADDNTGCGRKKSPIWEANKFKTKEDTANVFFYFWKVHKMPFYINVF